MRNYKIMEITSLIEECTSVLRELGYSEGCISKHSRIWNQKILPYLRQNDIVHYSSQIGVDYLLYANTIYSPATIQSTISRSVNILSEYLNTGTISRKIVHKVVHDISGAINEPSQAFLDLLISQRRKESTIYEHTRKLSHLSVWLDTNSLFELQEITPQHIVDFLQNINYDKEGYFNTIRLFCNFLHSERYTDINIGFLIEKNNFPRREKLPSIYTPNEINRIEMSIEQSSPKGKRDYAIFLLAAKLGLRASDIANLKFSNINWDENKIILIQHKTGKTIELPLLYEIGEAIITYIKYSRPVSNLSEIFLTAVPPYINCNSKAVSALITRIMRSSGVDISYRKFGSHSMRHSLASRLLNIGTSLPVISEVLGHSNTQSTMFYLRIDIDSLRKCALDVPPVDTNFYTPKGGVYCYE